MDRLTPAQLWPDLAPQWMLDAPPWLSDFFYDFYKCFIFDDRYALLFNGLKNTLLMTAMALIMGVVLGVLVAMIRVTWDKNQENLHGGKRTALSIANTLSNLYLTVIRGTPVMVQVMIMFLVIFGSSNNKLLAGVLCFGINSGAYVAEIIRSGIMSVDVGQSEAGRSLGFGYIATMWYIVIPQAFKTVLPALANEFIVLLKETAVAGYIGMQDLTYGANIIIGLSYISYLPLLAIAGIYLAMVLFFTHLVGKLERRLRNSER